MFCEKCGTEVTTRYCPQCGNDANPGYSAEQLWQNQDVKKNNIGLIVLVSSVGVVALAAVILFLSLLFIDSPKNTKYNNYQQTEEKESEIIIEDEEEDEEFEEEEFVFELNYDDDSYLYPTDEVYLTMDDLFSLSKDEVALLRNEIYARHGYSFSTQKYEDFFMAKSWYYPNPYLTDGNMVERMFNSYEKANKELLIQYEKDMGWR